MGFLERKKSRCYYVLTLFGVVEDSEEGREERFHKLLDEHKLMPKEFDGSGSVQVVHYK
jgi:hypothetical protein